MRNGMIWGVAVGAILGAASTWGLTAHLASGEDKRSALLCAGERSAVLSRLADPVSKIDAYDGQAFLGVARGSFFELWQACRQHGYIRPEDEAEAYKERERRQGRQLGAALPVLPAPR